MGERTDLVVIGNGMGDHLLGQDVPGPISFRGCGRDFNVGLHGVGRGFEGVAGALFEWVGGWVGGWVGEREVVCFFRFRMRCCGVGEGGWVGGWVGRYGGLSGRWF